MSLRLFKYEEVFVVTALGRGEALDCASGHGKSVLLMDHEFGAGWRQGRP